MTRVASILSNEKHLPLIYALMFGMPGIPCIYYGSEWGAKARKEEGDPALRPCFEAPCETALCDFLSRLSEVKKHSEALNYGAFRSVLLTNKQCIFERKSEHERVLAEAPGEADGGRERRLPLSVLKKADKDIARPDGRGHLLLRKAGIPACLGDDFAKNTGKFGDRVHLLAGPRV